MQRVMKPLSVLAYFDGRPGHEKQTKGILNALSDITPIEVVSIKVAVDSAAYLRNRAAYYFPFLTDAEKEKNLHPADLIIGTGTHTHIPMLLRKKRQYNLSGEQVRVVTCMAPDKHLLNKFDLCCIPMHDQPAVSDKVFITQGPPNTGRYEGRQQEKRGLILVGGVDTKSHVWKSAEIVDRIRIIVEKHQNMRWTVSSSPRTPEETSKDLAAMAAAGRNVTFFRSEDTPAGWIEEQYATNRIVWVTADSVSMVYESLTAGCSVGVLPVEWLHQDNKFQRSLDFLTERGLIIDFHDWQQGTSMPVLKDKLFNESKRCAEEILRRWWPGRLQ